MGFINSIFPGSSGTAHNGPQPPAPPAPPAAPITATPPPPPPEPETPVSHLDKFKSLWQTPTDADGKPISIPADPLRQPLFNLDPTKIVESTNKMDFTTGIPQETFAKITAGGPEAAAAFAEALNIGIRQAVAGLSVSNGQLINQALVENNSRITSQMPHQIKKAQLMDLGDDPVLSNPAVAPLVTSLKQMALTKNPNATAEEINTQVSGYLRGLGAALQDTSPEAVAAKTKKAAGEQDWGVFLGL